MDGIPWIDVHLMMIDAPFYKPPKTDTKNKPGAKDKKTDPEQPMSKGEKEKALAKFLNSF